MPTSRTAELDPGARRGEKASRDQRPRRRSRLDASRRSPTAALERSAAPRSADRPTVDPDALAERRPGGARCRGRRASRRRRAIDGEQARRSSPCRWCRPPGPRAASCGRPSAAQQRARIEPEVEADAVPRSSRARIAGHSAARVIGARPPASQRQTAWPGWPSARGRGTTRSRKPCSSRNSLRWKPSGSFWRMVCSITRGPAKPISAPGSAMFRSPSMAKLAVTPPVVGSVRTLM